jgi:protein-tyrosine phosphatase
VAATLPEPRTSGRYTIAVVCLGNICRSPMAHVVLESEVADAGLDDRVEVVSAGTADWHTGKPMDRRAAATLTGHGYDASRHRAQQMPPTWLTEQDLVLAMDHSNLADLLDLVEDEQEADRVRLFRDFDPLATDDDREVPDPYYGADDGFEHVLRMVRRTSAALVSALAADLGDPLA